MLKDLELSPKDHQALFQYCKEIGITFLSTPFHEEAVDLLDKFGVQLYKVGSGDLNNTPFLKYISSKNKPIILSTGMADMIEIRDAVKCITENQKNTPYSVFPRLTLLHCVSCYPTPFEQVNLNAIRTIREAFSLPVGFSDHTLGIAVPVSAVALGASIIEKHITLSRYISSPDSAFSLEPEEFKEMVVAIRTAEKAIGKVSYGITTEEKASHNYRRSLFAVKDIAKKEKFSDKNVRSIRPGNGLAPKHLEKILGKNATSDIKKGTPLSWDLISSR